VLVAYCMWNLGTAPPETYTHADMLLDAVASFIVDGKMSTILAFLFGLGFSIQLGRAGDEAIAVHYYWRRLAALAIIGLVHALLLGKGDFLLPAALTGFLLFPFRHVRDGVLLGAGAVALLIPDLVRFLWEASTVPLPERPEPANAPYLVENAAWCRFWIEIHPLPWPNNLALFLLGFFAGRRALLTKFAQNSRMLFSLLIGGVIAGSAFYLLRLQLLASPDLPLRRTFIGLTFTFHCWGLASAYVAGLLLLLRT